MHSLQEDLQRTLVVIGINCIFEVIALTRGPGIPNELLPALYTATPFQDTLYQQSEH